MRGSPILLSYSSLRVFVKFLLATRLAARCAVRAWRLRRDSPCMPCCGVDGVSRAQPLEEIVVTASLRPAADQNFAGEHDRARRGTLRAAGLQHFEDVLALVPNLNWAGGTSRPRYFQIRGIGELEQYQGAPNPSVGFLIDGIDFSGVGMPATLFDVGRIEVLRGPQGTRYGANALAGLIKLNTHAPERVVTVRTEATAGDDGDLAAGIVAGGPIGADDTAAAWRLVAQRYVADGFRHNVFLDRDDTNDRDELTLRGRVAEISARGTSTLSAMLVDLDNGYDVFTIDNSFTTRSDRPGQDAQRTVGGSVVATGAFDRGSLVSTTAVASSDIVYSFDGDWASDEYWGEFAPYDYFSRFDRERRTLSQDLRWLSASSAQSGGFGWIAGLYVLDLDEDNRQRDEFEGELLRPLLSSRYSATNLAAYGEAEVRLGQRTVLSGGLRVESRTTDYEDSDGARFDPADTMLGGHVSMTYELQKQSTAYVTASRGYKAGGFNIGALVPDTGVPSSRVPVESRDRSAPRRRRAALFARSRVRSTCGAGSAGRDVVPARARRPAVLRFLHGQRGQRTQLRSRGDGVMEAGRVAATAGCAGLARNRVPRLSLRGPLPRRSRTVACAELAILAGRAVARRRRIRRRVDLSGSDSFYFDASHDQRSDPYTLVNLKLGYEHGRGRPTSGGAMFSTTYALRGFYFGLEPPDFPDKLYVHRGDPRSVGITVEWRLR